MHTKEAVLVIGGAGYIGSHMLLALQEMGYQPIVLDNLSTGHRDAVLTAECIIGEMTDKDLLRQIFSTYSVSAVMHFASFIEVAESVKLPGKYYQNNIANLLPLLDTMIECDVKQLVFSSSAAVYGEPQSNRIGETHPLAPINPYGRTKRMAEEIIADYAASYGLRYAALRYFNAAGADPYQRAGERHKHESHLIPLVLAAARGERECIYVYGNDYPTPDGTCVRDYVHVSDLCQAHLLVLQALQQGKPRLIYNLGNEQGYSVLEVIETAKMIAGCHIPVKMTERRPNDPAILVADASLIKQELNWRPQFGSLSDIVGHVWQYINRSACSSHLLKHATNS